MHHHQQRIRVSTDASFSTAAQLPYVIRIVLASVSTQQLEKALSTLRKAVEYPA